MINASSNPIDNEAVSDTIVPVTTAEENLSRSESMADALIFQSQRIVDVTNRLKYQALANADQLETRVRALLQRLREDLSSGKFTRGEQDDKYYAVQEIIINTLVEELVKAPIRRQITILSTASGICRAVARDIPISNFK